MSSKDRSPTPQHTHSSNHHTHKPNHKSQTPQTCPLNQGSSALWSESARPDRLCSKISGDAKNLLGKAEETIGDVTGLQSWKTSGQERQAQGDAEHKQAQAQGYVQGTQDRVVGKKDQVVGAVTGDTTQETTGAFN